MKLIFNMKVTNVYIHQKIDQWRTQPLRSPHNRAVSNEGEGTYPFSEYYTATPGKKPIICHAPLISPHQLLGCFGFF